MKENILKLHDQGKSAKEISEIMDCSIGTVYWHTSEKSKQSILANKRKRRGEIKHKVKSIIFGGKCCLCDYNKSLSALDFHHKDKDDKEHLIAKILNEGHISRLETELKKVILVCKNCHCEIHDGLHSDLPESPYKGQSLRVE
jgi:hypothetical protein